MFLIFLRALHLQWWVVFVVIYCGYIILATWTICEGYVREVLGWKHPGQPSKLHRVLYHFHTGLHIHPDRSHGDERTLGKISGRRDRQTYYSPYKRWHRALRNNLIIFTWLTLICGMAINVPFTVSAVVVILWLLLMGTIVRFVISARKRIQANRPPESQKANAYTNKAKQVFSFDKTTIGSTSRLAVSDRPQLNGVSKSVMSALISGEMGCSVAEVDNRLRISADRGELVLPDSFAAKAKQREPVQEVIEAHTKGLVRFEWDTTRSPRRLSWIPVVRSTLPDKVLFRDYRAELEILGPREFGVGLDADRNIYVSSHDGDSPWHCRFAGSGTGKSMGFLVKAAQVCHKNPAAEVYCIDTKQVSFEYLRGIPRVYIYDNPQSEMDKIYEVFYTISKIMDQRYTAMREGKARPSDFNDIWLFVDEGNDLGGNLKSYWKNIMEETSASPAIWGEAIGRILRQGRQVRIFGEWMFQDLTDRAMGGESLKMTFNVFGAAGYLPGQFSRTIGGSVPDLIEGPGKILMCSGNKRTWVQGFYDDENWLHEYALENRRVSA